MIKDLTKFFAPKSIAVVGASEHEGKVGNVLMQKLLNYNGEIIPVNPKHDFVCGKKSYSAINDFPGKIDLVIIVTPAKTVNKILEDCARKTKNVIIISAGFSEIKEIELEKEIVETAKKYNLNILGPNCFGIANPCLNLDCTFANVSTKPDSVAFISQSGALWSYVSDLDLEFSKFVSLGNMAGLNFSDFIKYLNEDNKVKKIVLYIEALNKGKGKEFMNVCKSSKKKILAVKVGKTSAGQDAAISHTGSLATDYEIYKGALKQAGVKQVETIAEALEIKTDFFELVKEIKKALGSKISIITNAGGAGALLADHLELNNLKLEKSPVDVLGTALAEDYQNALDKDDSGVVLIVLTPQKMSQPLETAKVMVAFQKQNKSKKLIACFLGGKSIKSAKEFLEKNNIPVFTRCV